MTRGMCPSHLARPWLALGIGVGTAVGVALDQLAIGLALGLILGFVLTRARSKTSGRAPLDHESPDHR